MLAYPEILSTDLTCNYVKHFENWLDPNTKLEGHFYPGVRRTNDLTRSI